VEVWLYAFLISALHGLWKTWMMIWTSVGLGKVLEYNLNNVRHKTNRTFRNKKRGGINDLQTEQKYQKLTQRYNRV
jgi:hypothetical protein